MNFFNEADHNYLATENDNNTNVIYVVDPQATSSVGAMDTSNLCNGTPQTIFVCNPNFSNMTVMDVGAIQTVAQDPQIIS